MLILVDSMHEVLLKVKFISIVTFTEIDRDDRNGVAVKRGKSKIKRVALSESYSTDTIEPISPPKVTESISARKTNHISQEIIHSKKIKDFFCLFLFLGNFECLL